MKHLITIILFILSLNCLGQTKEQFLNSVHKVIVDTSYTKYFLYSDAYKLQFEGNDKSTITKALSDFIPIETINEFLNLAESDTSKLTWNCDFIDLANCVKNNNAILLDNFVVQTNSKWSKKKQKVETDKQVAKLKEGHQNKAKQEKEIYSFSRPIFDNKNEFAIIGMWVSRGNTNGHGCLYLFKRMKGAWQSVTTINCKQS